ncbi:Uncharacterised protein [uncultured archaeon]|nr:Uncharacterised protein [uncultured archaeon]
MPKIRIRIGPSRARVLKPKGVIDSRLRTTRIQTLPQNMFTIRGRPSRVFSMNTNYAKVSTNQKKAEAFDNKSRYLRKSKRRVSLSSITVRTHNKEYSRRIAEQDTLRRENDRLAKQIKWKMLKIIGKIDKASVNPGNILPEVERAQIEELVSNWAEHAAGFFPGEDFFLQKGPNNIARKLSVKRMGFIANNAAQISQLAEMLHARYFISEDDYHAILGLIEKGFDSERELQRKYLKRDLPKWLKK